MRMNMVIISKDVMKPSQPTPPHLRYLKSSLFDHVNNPVLMPLIFFYSNKQFPTPSSILTRLKNLLPQTLSIFYPLAGRVQDSNYIHCNDEGVPFVQAHVLHTRLTQFLHNADVLVLDQLLPTYGETQGYTKLLLVIQVNSFACGGIAIGLKISHAISDGFSFAMFVKTWAELANNSNCVLPRPCFEIWKIFPPHPSVSGEPNPDIVATRPATKWFMFNKSTCDALRSRLCADYDNMNRPSLTMVLSAFIWSRIKLARRSEVKNKPNEIYHTVNLRPKVDIPLGYDYYFGNMVVNALANPSENCFDATRDAIEKIIQENEVIDEMRNGRENMMFMKEHFEKESKGELVSLGFTTLRSLPVYESDFGWGNPVWVTTASQVFKDLVMMIPGPGGSLSLETYAYISLIPEEMKNLEADSEFMSVVSNSDAFVTSKMKSSKI